MREALPGSSVEASSCRPTCAEAASRAGMARAAQRENKQRTWDDFAAVAEDLIGAHHPTASPRHQGGSHGGLLVTGRGCSGPSCSARGLPSAAARHAALSQAAGRGFVDGGIRRPGPTGRCAYIAKYSPYQNVSKEGSTRAFHDLHARRPRSSGACAQDGRPHDGARAQRALLREHQGRSRRGGNNAQAARMWAQTFSFLWRQLGPR